MKGKVVLVTGANGGLGVHITRAFLEAGASVVGTSQRISQSEFPGSFVAVPADISNRSGAEAAVAKALEHFGRLDVVMHTVGGFAGGQSVASMDDSTLETMIKLNLTSTFQILRATIPELRKSGNGRIVAIGSRAAVEPGPGVGAYSASKAAMLSLVRTVALENRDAGVTANVILPGTMDTPGNRAAMPNADFSKWVQPGNVAKLALFLASDAAREITGSAIPIYGEP